MGQGQQIKSKYSQKELMILGTMQRVHWVDNSFIKWTKQEEDEFRLNH